MHCALVEKIHCEVMETGTVCGQDLPGLALPQAPAGLDNRGAPVAGACDGCSGRALEMQESTC